MNFTVDFATLDTRPVAPSASFHEKQHAHGPECIAAKFNQKTEDVRNITYWFVSDCLVSPA